MISMARVKTVIQKIMDFTFGVVNIRYMRMGWPTSRVMMSISAIMVTTTVKADKGPMPEKILILKT